MSGTDETPQARERYQFQGRVLPMGTKIGMGKPISVNLTYLNKSPISLSIALVDSRVTVDCESVVPMTQEIFSDAYFGAMNLAHLVIDLACFHRGLALTVVLESWTDPLGVRKEIGSAEPAVAGISTSFDTETKLVAPLELLLAEPEVWEALHDLTQSLVGRSNTVINCARAVEGIRHLLAPETGSTSAAWAVMRDMLNLDRTYIQAIMDASLNPRHGKRGLITPETQVLVMKRSWAIMKRYLEFRLRKSGPLRDPEFPLLTG